MSTASRRHAALIGITLVIVVATLALALPAAAPVRAAVVPLLPTFVLVLGTIAGVWQLVAGIASAVANGGIGVAQSVPLLLGASAIAMVLAFLSPGPHSAPRLFPLVCSALLAAAAALISRVARARSNH
jgi:hypothetical protein